MPTPVFEDKESFEEEIQRAARELKLIYLKNEINKIGRELKGKTNSLREEELKGRFNKLTSELYTFGKV